LLGSPFAPFVNLSNLMLTHLGELNFAIKSETG